MKNILSEISKSMHALNNRLYKAEKIIEKMEALSEEIITDRQKHKL